MKLVLEGEFWWVRCFPGQEDSYDNGPENYKLSFVPNEESRGKIKSAGIRLKYKPVSQDEPEKMALTFKRAKEPRIFDNGNTLGGGAPIIKNANGDPWPEGKAIGNGSRGQILVDVYAPKDKPSMIGTRLEALKVLKHIPYEPVAFEDDFGFGSPSVNTFEEPEVKPNVPVKKSKTTVQEDMNDVLPF